MDRFSRDTYNPSSGGPNAAFHGYNHKKKKTGGYNASATSNINNTNLQNGGSDTSIPPSQYHEPSSNAGNNNAPPPPKYDHFSGHNGVNSSYPQPTNLPPSPQATPILFSNKSNDDNPEAKALTSQTNAATSYSAVAANDQGKDKDECNSTPFRNYNNYVKKALIQQAIDLVASKMIKTDEGTAKKAEEELASHGQQLVGTALGTPQLLCRATMGASLNGSFSLPPSASTSPALGANQPATGTPPPPAMPLPPPPPYGSRSPGGTSNRQFYMGPNGRGINVLDLASGRGGDIGKWIYGQSPPFAKLIGQLTNDPSKFVSVKQYLAVDIAPVAVEAACLRFFEAKATEKENSKETERLLRVRHKTPLANGHFYIGNCLVSSFFSEPPPAVAPPRSPSHSASYAPVGTAGESPKTVSAFGRQVRGASMSNGNISSSPGLPPQLPSYNEAVGASPTAAGIMGRISPALTPHHHPQATPAFHLRNSPHLGGVVDRFASPAAAGSSGALPPPFAFGALPPPAPAYNNQTGQQQSEHTSGTSPGSLNAPQQQQQHHNNTAVLGGLVIGGGVHSAPSPVNVTYLADAMRIAKVDEVNIVSVQFAFHYACFSEDNLRGVLRGISSTLRRGGIVSSSGRTGGGGAGGIFLLTTVDGKELSKRLIHTYNNQLSGTKIVDYRSGLFTLTAETAVVESYVHETTLRKTLGEGATKLAEDDGGIGTEGGLSSTDVMSGECLPLGTMYRFKLDGLVDCEEFVVPSEVLVSAAKSEGLKLVETHPFSHWLPEFSSNRKVKQQLGSDGVLGADDLDLISLYRTYVFEV